jgi:hypothetical protein
MVAILEATRKGVYYFGALVAGAWLQARKQKAHVDENGRFLRFSTPRLTGQPRMALDLWPGGRGDLYNMRLAC